MRFYKVRSQDIDNGPGIRVSLFVQGCAKRCPNCFNPESWNFDGGQIFTRRIRKQFLSFADSKEITGFSILGGEPLEQDESMLKLVRAMKEEYPNKTIWMWTGYRYEDLNKKQKEIVNYVDVLVDGEFVKSLMCPNNRFKGSTNQRIIDVQKTLNTGRVQLFEYTK